MLDAEMLKNVVLHSVATALANSVLPVPAISILARLYITCLSVTTASANKVLPVPVNGIKIHLHMQINLIRITSFYVQSQLIHLTFTQFHKLSKTVNND